jgi:hypothetical protein
MSGQWDDQVEHAGCAANETASRIAIYAPFASKLSGILFIPTAAMSHNADNYAVVDVQVDGESIMTAPFSFNTEYGDLSKGEALLLDCNDFELAAGDVVFIEITQESDGLIVPVFNTVALYQGA